eukprot:2317797-Prymnesium_polylepis.1
MPSSGPQFRKSKTSLSLNDPEVRMLLTQGKTLEAILAKLKVAKQQHDMSASSNSKNTNTWIRTMNPEGVFRLGWNLTLAILLILTCIISPMQLAFRDMFEGTSAWHVVDVIVDGVF